MVRRTWLTLAAAGLALCALEARAQSAPLPALQHFGDQSGPAGPAPPAQPAVDGEGRYWSGEDLVHAFGGGSKEVTMGHFGWTPEYRLSIVQRPYSPAARAPSEMHEDKTQIYFIISGTGTQVLGGKPGEDRPSPEGQHTALGPLVGGKSYRIKPGDVILIPPMTWHQTLADPGQTIAYEMVHVETRRRLP